MTLAESLAEQLPPISDNRHYLKYMPKQIASTIYFERTSFNETYNVILSMKQTNVTGIDNIPTCLIPIAPNVLKLHLSVLFENSFF